MVLESQLSHRIVNLLFTIANQSIKLTALWGDLTFENHLNNALCGKSSDTTCALLSPELWKVLVEWFEKVNFLTESSTYCLILLIRALLRCGTKREESEMFKGILP